MWPKTSYRSLWYGLPRFNHPSLLLTPCQVLDPSDRLGVEPKSSPSQLREHPLFTEPTQPATSEEPSGMPICWETLWTDPPVCPETGIVQPAPAAALPDDEDDSLWDNVVHEFSLVNINTHGANGNAKGSGGPYSPTSLLLPTGPTLDVPPDVVPTEANETVSGVETPQPPTEDDPTDSDFVKGDAQAVSDAAVAPTIAAASNSEPAHGDLGEADDPVLKAKDWWVINIRLPSPAMLFLTSWTRFPGLACWPRERPSVACPRSGRLCGAACTSNRGRAP